MIYERHGDYEVMEWSDDGECGVWLYPGAMDEVDPVIVLPTVEAARIWVQKKLATEDQPPAAETGARGVVADVMCRCGYMASQHWADGSCPGDGYPYPDAPENHVNDPELPYDTFMEILRKELHFPPDTDLFGEWAVIEAIRQDRAIIMTDEGKIERLEAELASVREQLAAAQREAIRLSGEYDKGWNGATQSMLSLFERALDTALATEEGIVMKRTLAEFRKEYPSPPRGGGEV